MATTGAQIVEDQIQNMDTREIKIEAQTMVGKMKDVLIIDVAQVTIEIIIKRTEKVLMVEARTEKVLKRTEKVLMLKKRTEKVLMKNFARVIEVVEIHLILCVNLLPDLGLLRIEEEMTDTMS